MNQTMRNVSNRLSLRTPQKESLEALVRCHYSGTN